MAGGGGGTPVMKVMSATWLGHAGSCEIIDGITTADQALVGYAEPGSVVLIMRIASIFCEATLESFFRFLFYLIFSRIII